jgi:hypothetical protein
LKDLERSFRRRLRSPIRKQWKGKFGYDSPSYADGVRANISPPKRQAALMVLGG